MKKPEPINDNVVILPTPRETMKDGILIPQSAVDHPVTGTVIAVGPNVRQMKVGDTGVYPQNYGASIIIDDISYLILPENKFLTILR